MTPLRPGDGQAVIEGSKNKSAQWAEMHPVFLAVVEELSNGKAPVCFYRLLAAWSGRQAMETWAIQGISARGTAPWKALWEFKGRGQVGHVNVQQKNSSV